MISKLLLRILLILPAIIVFDVKASDAEKAPKLRDQDCDKLGVLVYEDLGCLPERTKPDDVCPSGYDCRHFHHFGEHCYFNGVKYDLGEQIPSNISDLSCHAGCFCNEKNGFTCAVLDCAEWLGVPTKSKDCLRTYELDKCCSTGELCPPFGEVVTCEVDGEIYKEGQKFYPKNSCHVCVCQKGYAGKYEAPFCRKSACAIELHQRDKLENHCAPVYDDKEYLCCPFFWTCLSENDVINPAVKPSTSEDKCIFGNKNLKIGETIEKSVEGAGEQHAVRCECKLPPFLTCVIDKSKYLVGK